MTTTHACGPVGFDIDAEYPAHTLVAIDPGNSPGSNGRVLLTVAVAATLRKLIVGHLCEKSDGFGNATGGRFHSVDLIDRSGTFKGIAADALTAGDDVFQAADGELSNAGTVLAGVALESVAAGEWCEYMPARA